MIGLDGATFALLKPLMEDGVMPFLQRFVAEGVHGDLMSTRNPLTPPAWTSMITGRSPEAHGIYDFLRPGVTDDGSVYLKVNDFRDNQSETIWSIANRHDKRATSLNFYGMSPAPKVDGYIASGFVPWKHLRQGMYPPTLLDTIKSLPGFDYKHLAMDIGEEKKCLQGLQDGEHTDWIELQITRDTAWTDLCCHLMATDPTDLTAVVLDGPDKLQHLFWRYVDPAYLEEHPDETFTRTRNLCLDFYRRLDNNIERLVTAAGPDTNIILTSDHGFGATDEVVYLNEWLARKGYLKWVDTAAEDASGMLTSNKIKEHLSTVDWKNTTAFCPTPSSNAIYVKRDNGSGKGVKPSEYLDFCVKLREELLAYRNPADDGQVFTGVDLNKLEGLPYVEPSPDLTLHLRDGGFVSILNAADVVKPRDNVDGTHRPNGIFIGRGPDIANYGQIKPINLLDIAPMLLYFLDIPVPSDLEGHVPADILRNDVLAKRRIAHGGATTASQKNTNKAEATPEEKEALMNQLKILGYMD